MLLKGRSRQTSHVLNDVKLTHEVVPFVVIDKSPPIINLFMEGDASKTPTSHHITQEKFNEFIVAGWDKTTLPEFSYTLMSVQYSLP